MTYYKAVRPDGTGHHPLLQDVHLFVCQRRRVLRHAWRLIAVGHDDLQKVTRQRVVRVDESVRQQICCGLEGQFSLAIDVVVTIDAVLLENFLDRCERVCVRSMKCRLGKVRQETDRDGGTNHPLKEGQAAESLLRVLPQTGMSVPPFPQSDNYVGQAFFSVPPVTRTDNQVGQTFLSGQRR